MSDFTPIDDFTPLDDFVPVQPPKTWQERSDEEAHRAALGVMGEAAAQVPKTLLTSLAQPPLRAARGLMQAGAMASQSALSLAEAAIPEKLFGGRTKRGARRLRESAARAVAAYQRPSQIEEALTRSRQQYRQSLVDAGDTTGFYLADFAWTLSDSLGELAFITTIPGVHAIPGGAAKGATKLGHMASITRNAAMRAMLKTGMAPGPTGERLAGGLVTFLYMETPALSGLVPSDALAKALDVALNSVISDRAIYAKLREQSNQQGESWLRNPVVPATIFMDILMSSLTQSHSRALIRQKIAAALPKVPPQQLDQIMKGVDRYAAKTLYEANLQKVNALRQRLEAQKPVQRVEGELQARHPLQRAVKRVSERTKAQIAEPERVAEPIEGPQPGKVETPEQADRVARDLEDIGLAQRQVVKAQRTVSVTAFWRALQAPRLGEALRTYASKIEKAKRFAVHAVRGWNKRHTLSASEWQRVTYLAATPRRFKDLTVYERKLFGPVVKEVQKHFRDYAKQVQAKGAIVKPWPQSQIDRLTSQIEADRASLEGAKSPARQERLGVQIREAEDALRFLRDENVRYIPIARFWLENLLEGKPEEANRLVSRYFAPRKTVDIEKLATYLLTHNLDKSGDIIETARGEGFIKPEHTDLRVITGAYGDKVGRVLAFADVMQAAKRDGAVVPGGTKPNWPELPRSISPGEGTWRAHPAFMSWLTSWQRGKTGTPGIIPAIGHVKMLAFHNPAFLWGYDALQGFWLGSLRSIKTPKAVWRAMKSIAKKDEHYWASWENAAYSKPFVMPFDKSSTEDLRYGGVARYMLDLSRSYKVWKGRLPVDVVMKPLWDAAWAGDQFIRLTSYHWLRMKGFTPQESGQIAALFHADYADVPRTTRHALNHVFFTPTFAITMGRLQGSMLKAAGKALYKAAQLKAPDKRTRAVLNGAVGLAMAEAFIRGGMHALGFKTDAIGYRYTKLVIDEETDEEKELVITVPTPANVLLRWYYSFMPRSGEGVKRYLNRASWRLHPLWRVAMQVSMNVRSDGKPIWRHFDPDGEAGVARDSLLYSLQELLPVVKTFQDRTKEERELLRQEVGKLAGTLLAPMTFAYKRSVKDVRAYRRLEQLERIFEESTRTKAPMKNGELDEEYLDRWVKSFLETAEGLIEEMEQAEEPVETPSPRRGIRQ